MAYILRVLLEDGTWAEVPALIGPPGVPGNNGVGIKSIRQTTTSMEDNGENIITVELSNGQNATFSVINGSKGTPGEPGVSVVSFLRTSGDGSPGTTDIYTMTFSDGSYFEVPIYNGADGRLSFDDLTEDQKAALKGEAGTSVFVSSVSESGEDGGSNVVTFSDGKTLSVKNGSKGSPGDKGDPYTLTDTDKNTIAAEVKNTFTTETWNFKTEDGIAVPKAVYVDADGGDALKGPICKINDGISVVDTGLTYTRGVVELRKIGSILWVVDSGVYNFTDSFKATNNRTVLQFELPKALSNKLANVNGAYGTTGTIGYFPALAYENVTYTTFNCQSYLKRSAIGENADTFQLVYTGLSAINGGGLCGFHLKMPLFLIDAEG